MMSSKAAFTIFLQIWIFKTSQILDQGVFWSGHTEQERVGRSLAFVGDMNGDGVEDIMAGGGFDIDPKAGSFYLLSVTWKMERFLLNHCIRAQQTASLQTTSLRLAM